MFKAGNIILAEGGTFDRIYFMEKFTSTVDSFFATGQSITNTLCTDGDNLLQHQGSGDEITRYVGLTSTVDSIIAVPNNDDRGVTVDLNGNVITTSNQGGGAKASYRYVGFTTTLDTSFLIVDQTEIIYDCTWDGTDLYISDGAPRISQHAGYTNTVSSTINVGTEQGISFDGANLITTNQFDNRCTKQSGFTTTVLEFFTTPLGAAVGVEWDGFYARNGVGKYADVLSSIGADHIYPFAGDFVDIKGGADATASGAIAAAGDIAGEAGGAIDTFDTTDSVDFPVTANINEALDRKAVGGHIRMGAIGTPPKLVYHEGGSTASFKFAMGYGNNLLMECQNVTDGFIVQVYGPVLKPNRTYAIWGGFESDVYGDVVRLLVDGIPYTSANPSNAAPGGNLTAGPRGQATLGDPFTPASTLLGGEVLLQNAPQCLYNYWAFWGDKPEALLTDAQVREEFFEKGVESDVIISSKATQAEVQTAIDTLANSVRPDAGLCIQFQPLNNDADMTVTLDNITFDPLASIHIQWLGEGTTLTIINANGSDASIVSTPNGGTVNLITPANLNVSPLQPNSEVRVFLAGTTTELDGIENSGTSFTTSLQVNAVDVMIHALGFENIKVKNIDMTQGDVELPVDQVIDRQYSN